MKRFSASMLFLALALSGCEGGSKDQLAQGEELYKVCKGCHEMQKNWTGPMHCGLVGRAAGSVAGYSYSEAVKESGLVWDEKTLDSFLKSPLSFLPGTKMGFAGYHDAKEREALIAYLKKATHDPQVCGDTAAAK